MRSYNQVDSAQDRSTPHQTDPTSHAIHDLGTNNSANNSDGVESAGETTLLDQAVACLFKEYWSISGNRLPQISANDMARRVSPVDSP